MFFGIIINRIIMENIVSTYNSALVFSFYISVFFVILSINNLDKQNNRLMIGYLASNAAIIGAFYLSMHAESEESAQFWFINIKLFLIQLNIFIGIYISIQRMLLLKKKRSIFVLILQTINVAITGLLVNATAYDHLYIRSIKFALFENMWFRINWELGPIFYYVLTINWVVLLILLITLRSEIFKALFVRTSNLRTKSSLLYISIFLIPGMVASSLSIRSGSFFAIFNILPIVLMVQSFVFSYSSNNKFFFTVPLSKKWIFDNLPNPVVILDNSLNILDTNPAVQTHTGLERDDCLGLSILEVFPDVFTRADFALENLPFKTRRTFYLANRKEMSFDIQINAIQNIFKKNVGTILVLNEISLPISVSTQPNN
jgi:PAS domain-containing protein